MPTHMLLPSSYYYSDICSVILCKDYMISIDLGIYMCVSDFITWNICMETEQYM